MLDRIPSEQLLTFAQAAEILGCSRQAVDDRVRRETLPEVRLPGGGRRILASEVWPGRCARGGRPRIET